jgi:hypothetical protein
MPRQPARRRRALAAGGIDAAYDRCAEIKARDGEFYYGEDDLLDLALQMFTAKKIDLAIEVLGLNIHVFPQHIESYLVQAKVCLHKGETDQARESLDNRTR